MLLNQPIAHLEDEKTILLLNFLLNIENYPFKL